MSDTIHVPPPGRAPEVYRVRPRPDASWSRSTRPLDQYEVLIGRLGIEDPTSATETYGRCRALEQASREVTSKTPRAAVAAGLASGDLDPTGAHRQLVKEATASLAGSQIVREERKALRDAAKSLYGDALRALSEYPEADWLALLKREVDAALDADAASGAQRWEAVIELADLLRRAGALDALRLYPASGPAWYCADLLAYEAWHVAHADRLEQFAERRRDAKLYRTSLVLGAHRPDFPTLCANRARWRVGIYSAAEAAAAIRAAADLYQSVFEPEALSPEPIILNPV